MTLNLIPRKQLFSLESEVPPVKLIRLQMWPKEWYTAFYFTSHREEVPNLAEHTHGFEGWAAVTFPSLIKITIPNNYKSVHKLQNRS